MTPDAPVRQRWALVGAVAVVVVVVVIVVLFGLVPYPDLVPVTAEPDPPVTARLAYLDYEDARGECLHLVDGRGHDREVGCGAGYGGELRWLDDERLAVAAFGPPGASIRVIDASTGEVAKILQGPLEPPAASDVRHDGARVYADGRDGEVWVAVIEPDGGTRRVLELDGPATYSLNQTVWTSDGEWIVALDSIGRLVVVDAGGRTAPRLWAEISGPFAVS